MNPKDLVGARKAPLGYVPPALYIGASEAMAIGAQKYGPFNWREQPVQVMTYAEAMLRHLFAFIDGQDEAEDTGVHHLKHVLAGAGIILDAIEADNVLDNRPIKGPAADMLRALDKSTVAKQELHALLADIEDDVPAPRQRPADAAHEAGFIPDHTPDDCPDRECCGPDSPVMGAV